MSTFDTKCSWLPCRKQLGVMVWRTSKFSTRQFCCNECAQKWSDLESKRPVQIAAYTRVFVKEAQLDLFPELPRKTVFPTMG